MSDTIPVSDIPSPPSAALFRFSKLKGAASRFFFLLACLISCGKKFMIQGKNQPQLDLFHKVGYME
jgi:hypothetical protein